MWTYIHVNIAKDISLIFLQERRHFIEQEIARHPPPCMKLPRESSIRPTANARTKGTNWNEAKTGQQAYSRSRSMIGMEGRCYVYQLRGNKYIHPRNCIRIQKVFRITRRVIPLHNFSTLPRLALYHDQHPQHSYVKCQLKL